MFKQLFSDALFVLVARETFYLIPFNLHKVLDELRLLERIFIGSSIIDWSDKKV